MPQLSCVNQRVFTSTDPNKMSTHLSESEMLHLVEIYKDYECLWNVTHALYKDRDARQTAYKQILKKLNIPKLTVKDIPKKIKNLRSSYYQEIKRIRSSVRSGATKDSVYKPRVSWFTIADGFLSAFRFERELFAKRIKAIKNVKKDDGIHEEITTIAKIAENIIPSNKREEDEFDNFGKYIATILRSMPQEHSINAKTELQKTISDIQLRIVRQSNMSGFQSPYCSASSSSDYDHHHSQCLTPTSDSEITNIKIELPNLE